MKRILIVEDNPIEASQLESLLLLIDENLEVHITGKAKQALKVAAAELIDIFLLDYQLEDYNGFKLAEQIRKLKKYTLVPIVFVTGVKDREIIGYRNYHCYEYIIKPYSKESFIETMSKLILNVKQEEETLLLKQKVFTYIIKAKDIQYVEYKNRKITFYTDQDVFPVTNRTLTEIGCMAKKTLVKVHQSFLVNKNRITKIDFKNKLVYIDKAKEAIPIGRSFIEATRKFRNGIS